MIRAALRDLQWRRRRFVIAMAGVALVFAMSLVMTGLAASFPREVDRTLDAVGAARWAVSADASGPFTSFTPIPMDMGGDGSPVMVLRQTINDGGTVHDLVVIGVTPGSLGSPSAKRGDDLAGPGQVVVDEALEGTSIGDTISIGGQEVKVVGTVKGQRIFAGIPVAYVDLSVAQEIGVRGQPFATAFLFGDVDAATPPGLKMMSPHDVREDALRPLKHALASIQLIQVLLWVVAATIIGSVLYLQALERTRDFAVFKATGTSTSAIGLGLALQAVVLSLVAAAIAIVLAKLITPLFPMFIETPVTAMLLLPLLTIVVGLLSSLISLRRAVAIEPAVAFGG